MTDRILLVGAHGGETRRRAFQRTEHGVVAEPLLADRSRENLPFDSAGEAVFLATENKHDLSDESRPAVGLPLHQTKQSGHIRGRIVAWAGEPRRIDARRAVESIDHQAGVVGEAVNTVTLADPACLLPRVAQQRRRRLGNILVTAYVGQADNIQ